MKRDTQKLFRTIEALYTIKDLDSLLENILTEARRFVMADAGTIYLAARGFLYFSFVQNDTLFRGETKNKYLPSDAYIPIDKASIAGYVARTGEPILIDDVYHIQSDVSFTFNPAFDQKTNYRTESILGVPLKTRDNEIVGVLQLINATGDDGTVMAFSMEDKLFISQFALSAADAIEKARLSREMVLRMVDLAELRDPFETSQHAKRVGAYSVELYEKWARKHAVSAREIRKVSEALRTAAILHDVGKVAVSDVILKKDGQLTYGEKLLMRQHTILGARLFTRTNSFWDYMAAEVALNHHENWDGTGYPGRIDDLFAQGAYLGGPGKKGTEIPLHGRIVSIADVYDALVSQRAYKAGWRQEHALQYIRYQGGKKFDPELVSLFLTMSDLLNAISKKYSY
ncbi:MAG TPA: HD domain-containing phosphohydrolase [Spirochaetia bacterium]|nr:HD domain-containing phosphohydrolase [Spirochaetia bacterium]HTZ51157.1 HD domain-containing phosphohydrolase [Spirochaetia bacterium]